MLSRLVARDFRNFTALDLALPASGLAIVGNNGQGKTNLLEAAAYLSLLRSIRGARDPDVLRFGAPVFNVRAELDPSARYGTVSVGYERTTKRKRVVIDGVEQPRLTAALGAVPSVCFAPADVSLVSGGPGERRRFLDVALALSSPAYLQALALFRAALLRRNAALRTAQRDGPRAAAAHEPRVAVWEPALAQHGGIVAALRHAFTRANAARFTELAAAIGESAPVTMRYGSPPASGDGGGFDPEDPAMHAVAYRLAYDAHRGSELRRGTTLVGPHRDELALALGGRELRVFGSAGQQRSAAIALRLLELRAIHDAMGVTPLLLLDDPFAELDGARAAAVLRLIEEAGVGQTLLVVPRTEDIPPAFTRLERRHMHEGVVS